MRMSVRILSASMALTLASCSGDLRPEVREDTTRTQAGARIEVDGEIVGSPGIEISESGYLFTWSATSPNSSSLKDVAGLRKVYIFVPDSFVDAAKRAPTRVARSDGLRAFEYSKNDAFPESFCY